MITYILQKKNGMFIDTVNNIEVEDIKLATKVTYNEATEFFNKNHIDYNFELFELISTDSDKYTELLYESLGVSGLTEQVYKTDHEIDYDSTH